MEDLKKRLTEYYNEQAADYDPAETEEVLTILEEYDDNLSDLKDSWNKTLLLRLIDDHELYDEVDGKGKKDAADEFKNAFDE